jgi:uncharacterized protein (TIGR02757 family)
MLSTARAARLKAVLDPFVERFDARMRIQSDPVSLVRRYSQPADQEIAGLLASSFAFGQVGVFMPRIERVLEAMGPSPRRWVEGFEPERHRASLEWFSYRFHRAADLAALVAGMRAIVEDAGSLGAWLARSWESTGSLRLALAAFTERIRTAGLARTRSVFGEPAALDHLLSDPVRGSASKRLLLFLRWMVRKDEVDLGTWEGLLPRSALVVPLDTHLHRLSRLLGLTSRRDASWRTAEEITASLSRLDPEDPVRYDFVLCHLGMSGLCPIRRDRGRCASCPLRAECRAGRALRSADARDASRR